MTKTVPLNLNYTAGQGLLKLTVIVGNGQKANTLVKLADKDIVFGHDITDIKIDTANACRGKKIFIDIRCTDTNPDTNEFPIKIEIADDAKNATLYNNFDSDTDDKRVDENGDSLKYKVEVIIN